jgi:hypothetical protein
MEDEDNEEIPNELEDDDEDEEETLSSLSLVFSLLE